MKDHYRTLGIPENASEQEIKTAYRRLAKRYHPDVNAGAKGAEEKFKEIVAAYDILSDYSLRRAYDAKRSGRNLFPGTSPFYNSTYKEEEKKDPRRKEYSEEDLERARRRHKQKESVKMVKRKKLLRGMIITFILYVFASGSFEYWIEHRRQRESDEIAHNLEILQMQHLQEEELMIESMDSPYDSLFGGPVYLDNSPNHFVIYMPFSDAVICAVQNDPPYRTIRNEYIKARNAFVMPELPEGSYNIKLYTGTNWNIHKKIPDGRKMGGFMKNERFYKIHLGAYVLKNNSKKSSDTNSCDTIILNPAKILLDSISSHEFFNPGNR